MPIKTKCIVCGEVYFIRPRDVSTNKYCSLGCMSIGYKQRMIGKDNPNFKNGNLRVCEYCHKEYRSYNKKRKYCSKICSNRVARIEEKTEHCKHCNKEINLIRDHRGVWRPRTICEECRHRERHYRLKPINELRPDHKRVLSQRFGICLNCGKPRKKYKNGSQPHRNCRFCSACLNRGEGLYIVSFCSVCGERINKPYRKYCDTCWRNIMATGRETPRRVDANQGEIVNALRQIGCSVFDTSAVGKGFVDLVVARNGINYLIEVKTAAGKLNKKQLDFIRLWKAPIYIVRTIEEAIDVVSHSEQQALDCMAYWDGYRLEAE